MPKYLPSVLFILLGLAPLTSTVRAQPDPAQKTLTATVATTSSVSFPRLELKPLDDRRGLGKHVVIVPIEGPIDLGLVPFLERAILENASADALILKINTFGGRVDAAVKLRDILLELNLPTVAYVHRRAISAGALIALATDQIIFSSGGSMGAATPIQVQEGQAEAVGEKIMSYMRAEMRSTAEAKGRNPDIAEAMVDKDIEVQGVSPKGTLLTLSTKQAIEVGIATGPYDSLDEVLKALRLDEARLVKPSINWAEKFVRFITQPEVSGALMSLGLLALAVELYSPGLGLAGATGVIFLSLFFGGHMAVHLAGWEEVVLCIVGGGLLLVEVFITPGFGVMGVTGLAFISASMLLALLGLPLDVSWETGRFAEAAQTVLAALGAAIGLMIVVFQFLPSRFAKALVLDAEVGDHARDSSAYAKRETRRRYVGQNGVALTDLRPSGKVRIGDDILDVASQHEYINQGEAVTVVEASGMTIIVVKANPSDVSKEA